MGFARELDFRLAAGKLSHLAFDYTMILLLMNQVRLARCAVCVRRTACRQRELWPSTGASREGSHEAYPRSVSAQYAALLHGASCYRALGLIHPSNVTCLRVCVSQPAPRPHRERRLASRISMTYPRRLIGHHRCRALQTARTAALLITAIVSRRQHGASVLRTTRQLLIHGPIYGKDTAPAPPMSSGAWATRERPSFNNL